MNNKISISNIFILISLIFTVLSSIYPELYNFWMNSYYLNEWKYHIYLIQFFTSVFLHWWFFHFLANAIFIFIFWNMVEIIIWRNKFILFFIFSAIFIWLWLTYFDTWNTVWISGFCMAVLAYYTLELKSLKNPEYTWGVTAMIINIAIWFHPWISLLWHLFWCISWIIFYYLMKEYLRKRMVGVGEL